MSKQIRLNIKNPILDFTIKSYLILLIVPFIAMYLFLFIMYLLGGDLFQAEGVLMFFIWGFFLGSLVYGLSVLFCTIFIGIFNKKLMSGGRVPKFNKFPRLTLFALSFLAYVVTTYVIGWFLR